MYYPRELFSIDEARTRRNLEECDRKRNKMWDIYYSRYSKEERKQLDFRTRYEILRQIEKELGI